MLTNFSRVRSESQLGNKGKGKKRSKGCESEMKRLFPQFKRVDKKKRTCSSWTHRFVCLANYGQKSIPTTSWEKEMLLGTGLGEKKVVFETSLSIIIPNSQMEEGINFVNASLIQEN